MMVLLHLETLLGYSWSFLLNENRPLTNGITDSQCAQSPGAIGGCVGCVVPGQQSWAPSDPDHSQADLELSFRRKIEPSQQADWAISQRLWTTDSYKASPNKRHLIFRGYYTLSLPHFPPPLSSHIFVGMFGETQAGIRPEVKESMENRMYCTILPGRETELDIHHMIVGVDIDTKGQDNLYFHTIYYPQYKRNTWTLFTYNELEAPLGRWLMSPPRIAHVSPSPNKWNKARRQQSGTAILRSLPRTRQRCV